MSFLRLGALWALPLVLLPILIHLIHRRRHPTIPWAAMMFLQRAAHARRGGAKLRRWLILAVRTLVVAAILFALARPLSSGMFGIAASRVGSTATTIVILDRSPSMQRRVANGDTRQVAGLRSIAGTLKTLGADQITLFDSAASHSIAVGSADALLEPIFTSAADSSADVPRLLHDALVHLQSNDRKVADVWVCSDRRQNDWKVDAAQWKQISDLAVQLGSGVRYHLLDYPADQQTNASVAVTRARWVDDGSERQLAITINVSRDDNSSAVVPASVTVGGVTSVVDINVDQGIGQVTDFHVPTAPVEDQVYGQVSIPPDVNAADDQWFFTVSEDQKRRLGLVTETSSLALEVASEVLGKIVLANTEAGDDVTDQGTRLQVANGKTVENPLAQVECLIWQGQFPKGQDAELVNRFLQQGGSAIFFPPVTSAQTIEFQAVRWGQWNRQENQQATFDEWEFQIASHCSIDGEVVRLSSTVNNDVLAGKIRVGQGTAWFCGADVIDADDMFVKNGLVLYGLLSEAIDSSLLFDVGSDGLVAGQLDDGWTAVIGDGATAGRYLLSRSNQNSFNQLGHRAGVLLVTPAGQDQGRLIAINRSADESLQQQVDVATLHALAGGIDWNQVTVAVDQTASRGGFVREIWGIIWTLVIAGMLCEAWLSLPARARRTST
ncbi:MAG: BatA domain-containing protein [Planctomycetales bacterium]|nr:BatA domain-containing protein [Planctomycetales bacterium]